MTASRSRTPSSLRSLHVSTSNKKSLTPPGGARTENTFSAVPPCLPLTQPLCPAPTRRLPSNAGTASEDTEAGARSPRPLRPICCIALSLRSQHPELSVDAYGSFTSASSVCDMLCIFNTICVRLSRTIFHPWRTDLLRRGSTEKDRHRRSFMLSILSRRP